MFLFCSVPFPESLFEKTSEANKRKPETCEYGVNFFELFERGGREERREGGGEGGGEGRRRGRV